MGLDMYLQRTPKIENCTPQDIEAVEGYFYWKNAKTRGEKCTLKEWCGISYKDLNKKAIKQLEPYFIKRYQTWDKEHKYGFNSIFEEVGYWKKANAIHTWFVKNVQNSVDNCQSYEVSKEQLMKLYLICKTIVTESTLALDKVISGQCFNNETGEWENIYEDGYIITNPELAAKLLPTQSGFFFGGTNYDEYYMEDVKYTFELLPKIISETDFDKQVISYRSSW
jgi:hypothetical protein